MQLEILQETKEWIAINKPSGLLVEANAFEPSVESILKEKYPFIGIVHRLDRVTSGILLVAKKKSALKILNEQFSDKKIQKTYQAWVSKQPTNQEDTLVHYLYKNVAEKKAEISPIPKRGFLKVVLHFKVLDQINKHCLLEIQPETGKFHQIRAQLAFINSPILFDNKYNSSKSEKHVKHIALQAQKLHFFDPITNQPIHLALKENLKYTFV